MAPSATNSGRLSSTSITTVPTIENEAMTSTSSEMRKMPHFSYCMIV